LTIDRLERLRRVEFERIELYANRPYFDFHDRAFLRSVAAWFQDNALPAPGLHLPFEEDLGHGKKRPIPLLDPERRMRQDAVDEMKRCLELAERLPIDYAVLHLGTPGEEFNPLKFDFAYAAVAAIQAFAGVRVVLENIPNGVATLDRLLEFKSAAQLPDIGICYDTGHGRIEDPDLPTAIMDSIQVMHINDTDGENDDHLWPFDGTIDWPLFVSAVASSKFQGPLVLEPSDAQRLKATECRGRLRDLFDEALNSMEEFRLKYKIPDPAPEPT
jgi:sugar phosphate isomerase/epimerase